MLIKKVIPYLQLMRLHRPIGLFLLLWPTLWALWLAAKGYPSLKNGLIFTLGVVIMRSAGCVINDIADRHFDGFVTRTQNRPFPAKTVSLSGALFLFIFLCFLAFILVLFLNSFTLLLSCIALLTAIIYPFTKRITYFPQLFLGAAFAWAIPLVFTATTNTLPVPTWLLYLAAFVWPLAYDTFYAMADKEEDTRIGIRSTAIFLGNYVNITVALIYGLFFTSLGILGTLSHLKIIYFFSLGLALFFVLYQFWIIRTGLPHDYFRAFLNNNWVGLFIFLGIAGNYV